MDQVALSQLDLALPSLNQRGMSERCPGWHAAAVALWAAIIVITTLMRLITATLMQYTHHIAIFSAVRQLISHRATPPGIAHAVTGSLQCQVRRTARLVVTSLSARHGV